MKIKCARELLLEGLTAVLKTAASKSAMPVLSGIRVATSGTEEVELASTDMEMSLRMKVKATVEREGAAVLPGRLLVDIVRSLPAGELELDFNESESVAAIESGPAQFQVSCLPVDDFPSLPEAEGDSFRVGAKPLVRAIGTVTRAASREDTRPVLTGVLVRFSSSSVKMVATDSYRLSVIEVEAESTLADKKEMIVPRAAAEELARLCTAGDVEEVEVSSGDGQILFGLGGTLLSSRLIEGQFPNYQQLLPEEFKHEASMDKEELLEVVSRVGLMAQKNAPLRLKLSAGEMTVSAQTPQVGEASESMAVSYEGEQVEIGFNPEYLRDGIESVAGDKVVLRLISPLRPGLVKGEEDDFLYLIMPVRLTD